MRRKITTLFAAILMALAMAAPASAHFNTAADKAFGGPLDKAQGHYCGINNAATKGNTPFMKIDALTCFLDADADE